MAQGRILGPDQQLRELRFDCDGDTVLMQVDQTGPACHTGRRDCFYNLVRVTGWWSISQC